MNSRNLVLKTKSIGDYSKFDKFNPKTFSPETFFKQVRKQKKRNK